MICYPDSPEIRFVSDTEAELCDDYFCGMGMEGTLFIPRHFRYDGGSIPRFFWRFAGNPFQGVLGPAFLIHDALYASECVSRRNCDLALLRLSKVSSEIAFRDRKFSTRLWRIHLKPFLVFSAVRLFGWAVWFSHKSIDSSILYHPF